MYVDPKGKKRADNATIVATTTFPSVPVWNKSLGEFQNPISQYQL